MTVLILAYTDGQIIDGKVLTGIDSDEQAYSRALDWIAFDAPAAQDDWSAHEILPEWGPGREIKAKD